MISKVKILIVEDEMLIGAKISMLLSDMDYEIAGIIPSGEKAISHVQSNRPDMILMDINLKGKLDGIETANIIQESDDIPIIYLTSNTDEHHFNRAKSTRPYAFISKPFKRLDLQRAIELTLARLSEEHSKEKADVEGDSPFILNDRLFIREKGKMQKLLIEDILYIEADRNYCNVHTLSKPFLISITLKNMEERLPTQHFLRVHRSFIINCAQIDSVAEAHLIINKKLIPISKNFKPELLRRLKTI